MNTLMRYIREKPLIALSVLFALSRAILYPLFPFRTDFLPWLNQLLDINLLKNDLWNSLQYIHSTPPLYNLFIGLIVSIFPENAWTAVFTAVYFGMGLGMVLMTYRILSYLKTPQWLAFLGALILILNPILFRFEIIPFYTYPLAFLILLSVFLLIKCIETSKRSYLVGFLSVLLVLLLFRNFFHIIFFFIPIAGGICFFVYKTRRHLFKTAVVASIVFFAIGIVPSVRNQVQYGIFSSSTWQGMQLFSMTYFVPKDKIDALVADGSITPLAQIPRFQNPDIYYEYYKQTPENAVPTIDALYKTAGNGEFGNFNNRIYARTAKEYGEDTLVIMKKYPEYFVERFVNSVYIFFGFANYRYFDKTKEWLIFDGGILKNIYQAGKYFVLPALTALLFAFVLWESAKTLWQASREKKLVGDNAILLLYMFFILVYTFGVANVVELGENYTARVPVDPVLLALLLYFAWRVFTRKNVQLPDTRGI